jgi:outer membrane lipoprotein-sorting protein
MRGNLIVVTVSVCILAGIHSPARAIDTNIQSYICAKLDDFSARVNVVKADKRELAKINRDGGLFYQFSDILMRYKEPNKIRIEGNIQGTRGVYILDGTTQMVSIPRVNYKEKRDFGNAPGKKKTLVDVGIISEFYLTYTNAKFLREAIVDGVPCAAFEMRYKDKDDTSHQIMYIDPKTKVVRKRESYSQESKLQAVYYYKDVKEVAPGIWFPTQIEAQNIDRVIAGITAYKDIKVNTGIADSIFKL